MNKLEENIRYIAIANMVDRNIPIEYVASTKSDKKSTVKLD
jgi:hypothetical protein